MPSTVVHRRCSGCRRTLPEYRFHLDAHAPSGRKSRCRDCINSRFRADYAASEFVQERCRERARRWRERQLSGGAP